MISDLPCSSSLLQYVFCAERRKAFSFWVFVEFNSYTLGLCCLIDREIPKQKENAIILFF